MRGLGTGMFKPQPGLGHRHEKTRWGTGLYERRERKKRFKTRGGLCCFAGLVAGSGACRCGMRVCPQRALCTVPGTCGSVFPDCVYPSHSRIPPSSPLCFLPLCVFRALPFSVMALGLHRMGAIGWGDWMGPSDTGKSVSDGTLRMGGAAMRRASMYSSYCEARPGCYA